MTGTSAVKRMLRVLAVATPADSTWRRNRIRWLPMPIAQRGNRSCQANNAASIKYSVS